MHQKLLWWELSAWLHLGSFSVTLVIIVCVFSPIWPAGGSDVFSSPVTVEKNKKPAARTTEKSPKQPGKVVLFDDDDDDFFGGASKKPPDPGTSVCVRWQVEH